MIGAAIAARAEALVGVPFRLHGRDPSTGLDCVGVVAVALSDGKRPIVAPTGYALRNRSIADRLDCAARAGLIDVDGSVAPGDILLVRPGPGQHHLLVAAADNRFIHAHAGLRRVVSLPGPLPWPAPRHWRSTR